MLKTSEFSFMPSPGCSPKKFYFQESDQESIIINVLRRDFTNTQLKHEPLVRIHQEVRFCSGGSIYANVDSCINYFDRENYYQRSEVNKPAKRVTFLDPRVSTIAGMKSRDPIYTIADNGMGEKKANPMLQTYF